MRSKHSKRVEVYHKEGCIYDKLEVYISELSSILNSIPEEYRDTALIDSSIEEFYGDPELTITIFYYRPETTEEREERVRSEEQTKQEQIDRELEQLKRLQEKYNK
jgi:hypothetical protein